MRDLRHVGFVSLLCLLVALQGCTDDWDIQDNTLLTIGTVKVVEGNEYYFALDEGSTMYPGDTTAIAGYDVVDGQRAFIYFQMLDEEVQGYDYNARIDHVENILTKDIYRMPPEQEDSIGDDHINVTRAWLTKGYVNLQYQFYHSKANDKTHLLSLVVNEGRTDADDTTDYVALEFRHNAYDDRQEEPGTGLVSFKLDNIEAEAGEKKGLKIRIKTLHDGIVYRTVDFAPASGTNQEE